MPWSMGMGVYEGLGREEGEEEKRKKRARKATEGGRNKKLQSGDAYER